MFAIFSLSLARNSQDNLNASVGASVPGFASLNISDIIVPDLGAPPVTGLGLRLPCTNSLVRWIGARYLPTKLVKSHKEATDRGPLVGTPVDSHRV
jgi:hypothetical protein